MYDITAYLTIKNKTFYTVLTYYLDGIRKMKWVSTGFKENESKKKAEKKLIQIRDEFINKLGLADTELARTIYELYLDCIREQMLEK